MRRPLLVALAVLFFGAIYLLRIEDEMRDFEVNYLAGSRLRAGETLYQTADGHYMFKYFPSSALLYVPLSLLPLGAAKALWYALTVLCSILLFVVSKRIVWGASPAAPWPLLVLPPLVLAKLITVELKLGQINTLVTLVLLGMLSTRSEAKAGALWGIATAMKPYGLIFLPYFAVRAKVAALGTGLLVVLVAFLLPSPFYGLRGNLQIHRDWYRSLTDSTPSQLAVADNVSLLGFASKWSLSPMVAAAVVLVLALLMLLVIRRGRELPGAAVLEVAMLLLLIPLVSPLGWDYQLLTSVLALTLLARHWMDFSRSARMLLGANLAVIGLSIFDLMGRPAYAAFMRWSVLTLCALLLVGYLTSLRSQRLA